MKHKMERILKNKKGYTIMELIMVVAVIAIISTVVGVSIYGYMKAAYTLKANQTAKTVFYAAQNYLVDVKGKGALKEFNKQAEKAGKELPTESQIKSMLEANGKSPEEIENFVTAHNTSKFRYIYLDSVKSSKTNPRRIEDKTSDDYNVFFAEILEPYIKDSNVTDYSFLLEYDTTSGVVMSVFYSEKIDGFIDERDGLSPYDNNTEEKYNVMNRETKALAGKWQGYYGIYKTNQSAESVEVSKPTVKLVNGERLVLTWQDTNKTNEDFITNPQLIEKLYYEVELTSTNREKGEKALSVKIPNIKKSSAVPSTWENEAKASHKEGEPLFIYYEDENKIGTYELLLDCIHHSILTSYKEVLATDMLQCKVTAKLENTATTEGTATSNKESATLGGGDKTTKYNEKDVPVGGSGNLKENGTRAKELLTFSVGEDLAYTVNNARHFNNMRHVTADKDFTQTGDVNWAEEGNVPNKELFTPFIFAKESKSKGKDKNEVKENVDATFTGSYLSNATHTISGLKIHSEAMDKGANIGIYPINAGEITGMRLVDCEVAGVSNVGAIAGTNEKKGVIKDVEVEAQVSGFYPSDNNPESATDKEKYGNNIGGVIGLNKGEVDKIATGMRTVIGRTNVGGIIGRNESNKVVKLTNSNILAVLENSVDGWENFGGIAGKNEGASSQLVNCTNKRAVEFASGPTFNERNQPLHIGGIVGYNEGKIETCKSEDNVTKMEEKATACINGLNEADGSLPTFYGKFVGGIVGTNANASASITNCSVNAYITGHSVVGGLVGANWKGKIVSAGQIEGAIKGLIVVSGNLAGGVAGYTAENISGFKNQADIFGNSVVGGIIGFNGASFISKEELVNYDWEGYFTGKAEGTLAYYDALLTGAKTGAKTDALESDKNRSISNCENTGFIFAKTRYGGGIAGINWGKITNAISKVDSVKSPYIYANGTYLATADCVGGIAGLNTGIIAAKERIEIESILYGRSFLGGVVGANTSVITNYEQVKGSVIGSGDYVGGILGINTSADIIKNQLSKAENGKVTGRNYVGGLIGCNVLDQQNVGKELVIRANTGANTPVSGEAYVGGLLGYNTILSVNNKLSNVCYNLAQKDPYAAYKSASPSTSEVAGNVETKVTGSTNNSAVEGIRYVGGIIGFNEENSVLKVEGTTNRGNISIIAGTIPVERVKPDIIASGDIAGTSYFIGGITGRNTKNGRISTSYNSGSVSSPSRYLGGLCEINEGIIENCSIGDEANYITNLTGEKSVGGIVGLNHTVSNTITAKVSNCTANQYTRIIGVDNTGGLVGTNKATIENCKSLATINAKGNNVGGVVGINYGILTNNTVGSSSYSPKVEGLVRVGGFVGNNLGATGVEINNLNNYADVTGVDLVGGIVGSHNASQIRNCNNYGQITSTGVVSEGAAGGITGVNDVNKIIMNCKNYGTVISARYMAGGITGWNKGILQECVNEGSVIGYYKGECADYVGGITGLNDSVGKVTNCISQLNSKGDNSVSGSIYVGGVVGENSGLVDTINPQYRTMNIAIKVTQSVTRAMDGKDTRNNKSYIGGIIGRHNKGTQVEVADFVFGGSIHVTDNVSQQQFIGGILGAAEMRNYRITNCQFIGRITGSGNNQNVNGGGGVGGICGYAYNNAQISLSRVVGVAGRYAISEKNVANSIIEGAKNVGGVVGNFEGGKIVGGYEANALDATHIATNYTNVKGNQNIGGIFGRVNVRDRIYEYMNNQGEIVGNSNVGGVIGTNNASVNVVCENLINESQGKILAATETATSLGGIIGSGTTTLQNCENKGSLQMAKGIIPKTVTQVGGISGNASASTIKKCINSGKVYLGTDHVGGIIGSGSGVYLEECENAGEVNATAKNIGGIAGYVSVSSMNIPNKIINSINTGEVVLGNERHTEILGKNAVNIGGIVGQLFGNQISHENFMINSRNEGAVKVEERYQGTGLLSIGGIAGFSYSPITIQQCKNEQNATVDATTLGNAGGIIGRYNIVIKDNGIPKDSFIIENTNYGSVKGGDGTGGILGRQEDFKKLTFSDNNNEGRVEGGTGTGGIIGFMRSFEADGVIAAGSIEDCNNTETAEVHMTSLSSTQSMSGIGGIVGESSMRDIPIKNCVNEGTLSLSNDIKSLEGIGGIIGRATKMTTIENSENKSDMNFHNMNFKITGIGGIAGIIGATGSTGISSLVGCENNSNIWGKNTDKTGGIVGDFYNGTITACNNKDSDKVIQGNTRIGGIAGAFYGTNSMIMGSVSEAGVEPSYNQQRIEGNDIIGGIVGEQERSAIYTVYNTGTVEVKGNKYAAGGIVGISKGTNQSGNTGLIINCYNLGNVKVKSSVNTDRETKSYVGGIVGFRENNKVSYQGGKDTYINNGNSCNSTVIKDSFYLKEKVDATRPALTMNGKNVKAKALAIGNEPFDAFETPNEDSQGSPIKETGRFEWSKETFENMLEFINRKGNDTWKADDEIANINAILKNYVYELPTPKGEPVTGVEGYLYNMKWASQVGLNSGLIVSIYDQAYSDEVLNGLNPPAPLLKFDATDKTTEGVSINMGQSQTNELIQKYMGKTVYVATKAMGYKLEDQNIYITKDSPRKIVQSFVLMPPLLEMKNEDIIVEQALKSLKVKVTIKNLQSYLQKASPKADYTNLVGSQVPMYEFYKLGLDKIVIQDFYKNSENEGEYVYKMKEREILNDNTSTSEVGIDWEKDEAYITIDYADANNELEGRTYHTYRIQAVIASDMSNKSLAPSDNLTYRYLSSIKTDKKYQLKTETMLEQPVDLLVKYTGDLIEPSYTLSWTNPKGNAGKTLGYEVTVTNTVTKQSEIYSVDGENTKSMNLTYENIQKVMTDFEYGKMENKLTFSVKAISKESDRGDSFDSVPYELVVPLKQKTVDQVKWSIKDPIYAPNVVEVTWSDTAIEELDTGYRIMLKVDDQEPVDVEYTKETKDTTCIIKLPEELDTNKHLKIQIVKTGKSSISLDSNSYEFEINIRQRLPQVTGLDVPDFKMNEDSTKIVGDASWMIPVGVTADNCAGYWLALLPYGELEIAKAETVWIEGGNISSANITFDITSMGSTMDLYIYAVGKDSISSTSKPSTRMVIEWPEGRIPSSTNLTMELRNEYNQIISPTQPSESDLMAATCALSWLNPTELGKISGQRLILKDDTGKIIPLLGSDGDKRFIDITGAIETHAVLGLDLRDYQGKKLSWSVINKPQKNLVPQLLSSEPVTFEFIVPTVPK